MGSAQTENHTVLIAEDEAMLRIVAVETLKDDGFTVYEAGDGVSALEILRGHPEIELLISDIKMPRLGGYELAEGALIALDVKGLPLRRSWCAVYPRGKNLTPVAAAFLRHLTGQ